MFTAYLGSNSSSGTPGLCRAFFITALLLIPATSALRAQAVVSAEQDEVVKLDPFTVEEKNTSPWKAQMTFSGSRVAENVMDVPLNISIVTDQYIRDVGAFSLNDLLNYAGSGVNSRVSYREDFSIRGYRQSATWNGLDNTTYGNTPLYDIERVEFIKGPTALVFSSVSNLGGTVNYVTKRPTATPQGDLTLLAGIDNRYGADVTQRGPINQSGSVRYRVTAGFQRYDGFRELEYENNQLVSTGLDWLVNEALTVRFDFSYTNVTRRDFNRDLVDPTTGKLATSLPDDFTTTADWSKVKTDLFRSKLEVIYRPTTDLTFRVLYGTYDNDYTYHLPQPFPGLKAAEAPNFVTVGQRMLDFDLNTETENVQADVVWNLDVGPTQNRLTAGWDWGSSDSTQLLFLGALPDLVIADPISSRPPAPVVSTWSVLSNTQRRSSGWTAFAQDSMTLLEGKLILSGGVRYVEPGNSSKNISVTVPRYGIVYKFTPELSAYYGYAKSYSPLSGVDILGRPYVDIEGKSEEVGLKLDLFGGKLFGSLVYFDMLNDPVVTQVQVTDSNGNILYGNVQTAEETNKGFEADIGTAFDVGPGKWFTYLTYYSAKPRNAKGVRPARVVEYKGTFFTRYEMTEGPMKGFSIGGGVSDFGDQTGTGIALQEGYTLYSVILGYTRDKWSYRLNIDNATDVQNAVTGSEASFSVHTARPRDIRLSATYRW